MTDNRQIDPGRRSIPWRIIAWSVPVLLLLTPLMANAPWTLSDFIVMGVLFGIVWVVLALAVRASGDRFYRAGAGVAVAAAFLLVWVNAAVGFLGSENNPANLMFGGVIAVVVFGAFFARARPAGMASAMSATATAQFAVGAVGLAAGLGSPGNAGLAEAVLGTGLFTALWLTSAALFRKAAGTPKAATGTR